MAKKKLTLTQVGLIGGGGFAAYHFLWKPLMSKLDAATAAQTPSWYTSTGGGGGGNIGVPAVTFPSAVGPQPSNLNPGAQVGGPVGYCMWLKGWSQSQCQARLDALMAAYNAARTQLAALKGGGAAGETQAQITRLQSAIAAAEAALNAANASGDVARVDALRAQLAAHRSDLSNSQALLSQIPAKIAAYENDLASVIANYKALTGVQLAA